MAKFNEKKTDSRVANYMGAPAYKADEKTELVGTLLTSFAESSYYEGKEKTMDRLSNLVEKIKDKLFVAKAAIFARNEFGMRSITHITAGDIAKHVKGENWTKRFFDKVVYRVDDITEILSYYLNKYKKPIPNSLKRGLGIAINKFDEYQLAKYKGAGHSLSLIDAFNLIHPKPQNGNSELFKKLIEGKLKSKGTWESELSAAGKKGNKEEAKKEVWADLINSGKIGYFALLRNLRNILIQAPESIDKALDMLTDEKRIRKSLVLPFRYLSAYNAINEMEGRGSDTFESERVDTKKVVNALNKALEISVQNLPLLAGQTLILSDNSGSMSGDGGGASLVSSMSKVTTANIANLFAVMYWTRCKDTLVGLFGDELLYPELSRSDNIFNNFRTLSRIAESVGGGTETGIFTMFKRLVDEKMHVDTIVVFSDCQIGTGCKWCDTSGRFHGDDFNRLYEQYRKINPNFRIYSIDLKGYGTTVFSDKVFKLYGWSEKIFSIMKILEQDKKALVHRIESIEI